MRNLELQSWRDFIVQVVQLRLNQVQIVAAENSDWWFVGTSEEILLLQPIKIYLFDFYALIWQFS